MARTCGLISFSDGFVFAQPRGMTRRHDKKQKSLTTVLLLFFLLALLSWITPNAFADVNMKDASYNRTDVDVFTTSDHSLDIERVYDSRSLRSGLFGFGWCSVLDTRVLPMSADRVRVQDCGTDGTIIFTAKAKTAGPYFSPTRPNESLEFDGLSFTRTLKDGTLQRFDRDGRLLSLRRKEGGWIELRYSKSGAIAELRSQTGLRLRVETHMANGKIACLRPSIGKDICYRYKGDDLLAALGSPLGYSRYQYDRFHNLISARIPTQAEESISYDTEKDRVISLTGVDGCRQTLSYRSAADRPRDHYFSQSVKTCGGRLVSETEIEFQLKTNPDGTKYLERTKWSRGMDSLEILYHPSSGLPLRISRNGQIIKETI